VKLDDLFVNVHLMAIISGLGKQVNPWKK
jgi:hypothetical protein